MLRSLISFVTTVLIAGALGFASGVYFAPTEEAARFRGLIDDNLDLINKMAHSPAEKPRAGTAEDAAATSPAAEPEKAGGSETDAASREAPAVIVDPVPGTGAAPGAEANDAWAPAAAAESAQTAGPSATPSEQPAAEPPAPKAKPPVKKPAPKPAAKPKPKPKAEPAPQPQAN